METTSHLVQDQISIPIGDADLIITVGPFAGLANQSLICRYGDTQVLVAVTMSKEPREGIDFFPLVVNFEEKMYAAGKIPGGFIKKEGRPTDQSILTSRCIDRPIRPLFPKGLRNEVQVVILTQSADQKNPPDIPAMIGTGAALYLSDIPFTELISAVRVGMNGGEFVVNPTFQIIDESPLDLVVVGTRDGIMMIEAGCNELADNVLVDAVAFAHDYIREIISGIEKLHKLVGKEKLEFTPLPEPAEETKKLVSEYLDNNWSAIHGITDKKQRELIIEGFKQELLALKFDPEKTEWTPEDLKGRKDILDLVEDGLKKRIRERILKEELRPDNRTPHDIRSIWCEVGNIPRAHGSAIFTRGETQAMSVTTLGAIGDKQRLDDIGVYEYKRYMHHYYSAPFSFGDTGFMRGPGRREIGHGALAERALKPMIPPEEEFPYTIRLVTEILSSNGSTSMAAVSGSTLSLMDAGVPISNPVAGVAIGLVTDPDSEKYVLLSDLMGIEDFYGDMDFKVAGTKNGIVAIQMDLKIHGISLELLTDVLERASKGREHVLGKILETIAEPRAELSPYAPRIITVVIDPEKIGDVIGPGGKMVRSIIEKTGVEIDIEDDGRVFITSTDAEGSEMAVKMIEDIVREPEVGEEIEGRVVKLTQFGAFVKILPTTDGLLHISQICDRRVEQTEDALSVGDKIRVKVRDIDPDTGKISLTRRGLDFPDGDPILERVKNAPPPRHSRPPRGRGDRGSSPRGGRSGGYDRDRNRRPKDRR